MVRKLDFEAISWTEALPGARSKNWADDERRIRILELTSDFVEPDWCTKDHLLYVISGDIEIVFADGRELFKTGDVALIALGNKHKARALTPTARLLLIEEVNP